MSAEFVHFTRVLGTPLASTIIYACPPDLKSLQSHMKRYESLVPRFETLVPKLESLVPKHESLMQLDFTVCKRIVLVIRGAYP